MFLEIFNKGLLRFPCQPLRSECEGPLIAGQF